MVPLLLIGMACLLPAAQAAAEHPQNGRPHPSAHNPIKQGASLLDTYIQLLKPSVSVAPKQSGRSGRTTLEVKLAGASSVNPYTPTVSPEVSGTVFDVLNTWDALKVGVKQPQPTSRQYPLPASTQPRLCCHCCAAVPLSRVTDCTEYGDSFQEG